MLKIFIYAFIGVMCTIAFIASDFHNIYSLGLAIVNVAFFVYAVTEKRKNNKQ